MSGLPRLTQFLLTREDAAENGPERDTLPPGNSLYRIPTDEMIDQRSPVDLREAAQCFPEPPRVFGPFGRFTELMCCDQRLRQKFQRVERDRPLLRALLPRFVTGNDVDPGVQRRFAAEVGQLPQGFSEGGGRNVLGCGPISDDGGHAVDQPSVVAFVEVAQTVRDLLGFPLVLCC
jgi:hypothetical protein